MNLKIHLHIDSVELVTRMDNEQFSDLKGDLINIQKSITTSMESLEKQLEGIANSLNEAATEIPDLIEQLKNQIGTVTPEGQALLESIKAKASALKDIVPDTNTGGGEGSGENQGPKENPEFDNTGNPPSTDTQPPLQ